MKKKLPYTYEKRQRLLTLSQKLGGSSHIIPLHTNDNEKTVKMCETLYKNGYFTLPIRKPTVPTPRIRLSLTTEISEQDLENLCSIIG